MLSSSLRSINAKKESKRMFYKSVKYSRHCPDPDYSAAWVYHRFNGISFCSQRNVVDALAQWQPPPQPTSYFYVASSKREHTTTHSAFIRTDRLSRNCAYSIVFCCTLCIHITSIIITILQSHSACEDERKLFYRLLDAFFMLLRVI